MPPNYMGPTRSRVDGPDYYPYATGDDAELLRLDVSREAVLCPPGAVLIMSGLILASNGVAGPYAVVMIIAGVVLLMAGLGLPGTGTRTP